MQWIETYAGYEGESEQLWGLYESAVLNERQLTAGELGSLQAFQEAPNPDSLVPCYVKEPAHVFAYWDSGDVARRMPWQRGVNGVRYYAAEAARQTSAHLDRLHNNRWVSAESQFVAIKRWDAPVNPVPLQPGERTPLVIAVDAAVKGDCFGLLAICRTPEKATPPNLASGSSTSGIRHQEGLSTSRGLSESSRTFVGTKNVVQVAYDPYQLHDFATRLMKEGVAWFRQFSQGQKRSSPTLACTT